MLINPLHAAEPVPPIEPSPYLPSSRRFANPLYLRPERIPEYAMASAAQREEIDKIRIRLLDETGQSSLIRPGSSLGCQAPGPQIIYSIARTPGREASFAAYRRREGRGLESLQPGRRSARNTAAASTIGQLSCRIRIPSCCDFAASCRQDRLPLLAAVADGGAAGWHPASGCTGRDGARGDARSARGREYSWRGCLESAR